MSKPIVFIGSLGLMATLAGGAQAQTTPPQTPAAAPTTVEKTTPAVEQPAPNPSKMTAPAPANKDTTAAADPNKPPLAGANSFTEAQAKQRIADAGFTSVSALAKDDNGIWRGTAMKAGKSASVAVDYKGNVVQAN